MGRYFIITIDTEGDNLWGITDLKHPITTDNANYLFRFQELCEKYGFIPTYLTNYEMANAEAFVELARQGIRKRSLEIGSHEHAWNQPPLFYLPKRLGKRGKPYIYEYPIPVIRRKMESLTYLLEDTFQVPIRSHRGGRWGLDGSVIKELERLGYTVDCSCTPGKDWSDDPGWSIGSKGVDWRNYPSKPFRFRYMSLTGLTESSLIEVPVTIIPLKRGSLQWLRPNGTNLLAMMEIVDKAISENRSYIEFIIHSSELMPGGSPTFKNKGQIELLYRDLDQLFLYIKQSGYLGIGLSDFAYLCEKRGL